MPCFDKDRAAFFAKRFVKTHVRTPDPGPGRVSAMLIFKDTFKYKDFFTPKVSVWIEIGRRCPLHQS